MRKIACPNGIWEYKIGKSFVVAYKDGKKLLAGHNIILGKDWGFIYRCRRKNRGTDHMCNITPQHIKKWIESVTQY